MRTVLKEILSPDAKKKVQIFRRDLGTFGFDEWRFSDEPGEQCWIPYGRRSECVAPDERTAEREARDRVAWLRGSIQDKA